MVIKGSKDIEMQTHAVCVSVILDMADPCQWVMVENVRVILKYILKKWNKEKNAIPSQRLFCPSLCPYSCSYNCYVILSIWERFLVIQAGTTCWNCNFPGLLICRSVVWLIGWLTGRSVYPIKEVTFPCSYRNTCFFLSGTRTSIPRKGQGPEGTFWRCLSVEKGYLFS